VLGEVTHRGLDDPAPLHVEPGTLVTFGHRRIFLGFVLRTKRIEAHP
jgi:hypothetical protein